MTIANKALAAYRNGLRASRIAFGNDTRALLASRKLMKDGMRSPPNPEATPEEQIQYMNDVAKILRNNVVQGERKDGTDVFELNIHKDIELGDNNSIKKPKSTLTAGAVSGGCCGGKVGR
ncbi:HEL333Wp [Eremothecium sinecaudum]|uniref:Mitochondrial zinc maintenance protein 1, mitochondrial n=1 Tax=Eremothecium sinecaudum TaxID=45286 RepID=A0A0X8HT65_9SACH|nr:HEL333Wp [Eremothecium sinecaudum]AMD20948.1 HEL333Wp [Eremothecium sinecaudum]